MMRRATILLGLLLALLSLGCDDDDGRDELEAQIVVLTEQVTTLRDMLDDAEAASAASASTLGQLHVMLAAAEAALATANTDLNTANASVATLTNQVAALQGQLDAVREILATMAGTVTLAVPFVYGDASLELEHAYPIAGSDDTVSFTEIRFWLSAVELERQDGSFYAVPDSFYLVEARPEQELSSGTASTETLPARRRETIAIEQVPPGVYTGVRFHVGVDAEHNDDLSIPGGELHLLQNMAFDNGWMWFTSYVFTKTKGHVNGPGGMATFAWDNGSNADYRSVTLPSFDPIAVTAETSYTIRVAVEVDELVATVAPRTRPTIGASSPANRTILADAFRDMFALVSVSETP